MNRRTSRAFTLIEMMIVVVVVGILATLAVPGYQHVVTKSRRSDAHVALTQAAAAQEKFFSQCNRYGFNFGPAADPDGQCAGGFLGLGAGAQLADSGKELVSPDGYYRLSFPAQPNSFAYTIRAIPQGPQVRDKDCASLTIDSAGVRSPSTCW